MDPNRTLELMEEELDKSSRPDTVYLDELAESLLDWIVAGGFEPDWSLYPLAMRYYSYGETKDDQ